MFLKRTGVYKIIFGSPIILVGLKTKKRVTYAIDNREKYRDFNVSHVIC